MVIGADSGMGEITSLILAEKGYIVFAGCYLKESFDKLKATSARRNKAPGAADRILPVQIDVTDQQSVAAAAKYVKETIEAKKFTLGLHSLINLSGIALIAPAEYCPIDRFERNLKVNLTGYLIATQAFLPLIKETVMTYDGNGKYTAKKDKLGNERRGRVIFTGTGGGVPSAMPGLLSPYMCSKWGAEALQRSFYHEFRMTGQSIDSIMLNPGYTKPTQLYQQGLSALEGIYKLMPDRARVDYEHLYKNFVRVSMANPGTHRSKVAEALFDAINVQAPLTAYRVGNDSVSAPYVALGPAWLENMFVESVLCGQMGTLAQRFVLWLWSLEKPVDEKED